MPQGKRLSIDLDELRILSAQGLSQPELARRFSCSQSAISKYLAIAAQAGQDEHTDPAAPTAAPTTGGNGHTPKADPVCHPGLPCWSDCLDDPSRACDLYTTRDRSTTAPVDPDIDDDDQDDLPTTGAITDPAWLYDQFITRNRSIDSIAHELGLKRSPVQTALHSFGIRKRAPRAKNKPRPEPLSDGPRVVLVSVADAVSDILDTDEPQPLVPPAAPAPDTTGPNDDRTPDVITFPISDAMRSLLDDIRSQPLGQPGAGQLDDDGPNHLADSPALGTPAAGAPGAPGPNTRPLPEPATEPSIYDVADILAAAGHVGATVQTQLLLEAGFSLPTQEHMANATATYEPGEQGGFLIIAPAHAGPNSPAVFLTGYQVLALWQFLADQGLIAECVTAVGATLSGCPQSR